MAYFLIIKTRQAAGRELRLNPEEAIARGTFTINAFQLSRSDFVGLGPLPLPWVGPGSLDP